MVVQWKVPIGPRVSDVVTGSDTDHVYVAADDCVTVMAGCDIVARIPVGAATKRLILGADAAFLYVVGYDGSVRIIRTADHLCMTIYGSPSTAEVVSPSGCHIYTAHNAPESADSLISVTVAHDMSTSTVAIDNYATGMDLSSDGGHLYVATSQLSSYTQYFPGSLSVIDTGQEAVVDAISVPLSPDAVTAMLNGSRVLVTHHDIHAISAIDLERRSVTSMFLPDAPLYAAVTPDGSGVYVICMQSLVAVNFVTQVVEIIPVGKMPRQLLFSEDGKRAYVTDLASSTVAVVSTSTNSLITAVELGGLQEAMALSRDGERLYVADSWAGTLSAISIASVLRDANAA